MLISLFTQQTAGWTAAHLWAQLSTITYIVCINQLELSLSTRWPWWPQLHTSPINNNNIQDNFYGAVIMVREFTRFIRWMSNGAKRPPTQDQARRLRLCVLLQAARIYTHHHHLLLLSPKADTHFTVPQRVEGWVDLAGWLHTEMVYPSTDGHPSWYFFFFSYACHLP